MQDCEPHACLKICVRTYMCSWRDMDVRDAGHVLGGIKNLQEKNKRLMLSACQDNSGPLVWFIFFFFVFFYCTLNVFVCISTKLNLLALPSLAPRLCWGVAIRWISAGFTTHSGRFCPEGTTSRWAPPFLIYTFNYAFFLLCPSIPFFCLAPLASESCTEKKKNFVYVQS